MSDVILDSIISKMIQCGLNIEDVDRKIWHKLCVLRPGMSSEQMRDRFEEMSQNPSEWMIRNTQYPRTKPKVQHTVLIPLIESQRFHGVREDTIGNNEIHSISDRTWNSSNLNRSLTTKTNDNHLLPATTRLTRNQADVVMVIHVCDEAKGVKQDFHCPRRLLVEEMRYFADYLASEQQRWEEVDISVHCDVQIFEWLMRFVKRDQLSSADNNDETKSETTNDNLLTKSQRNFQKELKPNNVISILISSEFLKMNSLVDLCIEYCHDNMNAILATPCNMNCINDKLVSRIAESFTEKEADEIVDKKDKFKGKIFMKKIEILFQNDAKNQEHFSGAATLFRCSACQRVLTQDASKLLPCKSDRMLIHTSGVVGGGKNALSKYPGELFYLHDPDPTWDVTEWLIRLQKQVDNRPVQMSEPIADYSASSISSQQWRDTFWRLWAHLVVFECNSCRNWFQVCELTSCAFHPTPPKDYTDKAELEYTCCSQRVPKFQSFPVAMGCQIKDHIISRVRRLTSNGDYESSDNVKNLIELIQSRRDVLCYPMSHIHKELQKSNAQKEVKLFKSPLFNEKCYKGKSFLDDCEPKNHVNNGGGNLSSQGSGASLSTNDPSSQTNAPNVSAARLQPLVATNANKFVVRKTGFAPSRQTTNLNLKIKRGGSNDNRNNISDSYEDEDISEDEDAATEVSDSEKRSVKGSNLIASGRAVTIHQEAILVDAPQFSTRKSKKWDITKSLRTNQDAQRQEDLRRMQQMIEYLTQLRLNIDKNDRPRAREYAGGLFSKLEAQWKSQHSPSVNKVPPIQSMRSKAKLSAQFTPFR